MDKAPGLEIFQERAESATKTMLPWESNAVAETLKVKPGRARRLVDDICTEATVEPMVTLDWVFRLGTMVRVLVPAAWGVPVPSVLGRAVAEIR
jgi:hypothetical protein